MTPTSNRKVRGTALRGGAKSQRTKEKLLQAALVLLETHFPEEITGEMVLEQAGSSRGTLYHHFFDVSDLMEQAMVQNFSVKIDVNVAAMTSLIEECTSAEQMYERLYAINAAAQSSENRRHRFFRARLISFAEGNQRLTERLGIEQRRLTAALTQLFEKAQDKRWMNKQFEPKSAALLVQAYTLGKVIDDISADHVDEDVWNELTNRLLKMLFC